MGFIYGLVDPRDGLVHYIGRASSRKRPLSHAYPNKLALDFTVKARWIRQLQAEGLAFGVRILADAVPSEELDRMEIWWIAYGRSLGWPLTNGTDGGDGGTGRIVTEEQRERQRREWAEGRLKHTPATIEKLRALKTGVPRPESVKQRVREKLTGRKASEETRMKMRLSRLGRPPGNKGKSASPETRAKMSAAAKGRTMSAESRAKISAAKRGQPRPDVVERQKTPEAKAHMARLHEMARGRPRPDLKGRNRTPEHRAALSRALKGRTFTEESLAKMRASQQKRWERVRAERAAQAKDEAWLDAPLNEEEQAAVAKAATEEGEPF